MKLHDFIATSEIVFALRKKYGSRPAHLKKLKMSPFQ